MGLEQRSVRHGAEALHALRTAIDELQGGDPLRPVSVIVPSNSVGVAARRWLARHGGIAATQFLTLYRLAELMGAPLLAATGRRPVSSPVIDHTVRLVVRRHGRGLRSVAEHPATIEALRTTYAELRQLDDEVWQRVQRAASPRGREVLDLATEVRRRLAVDWYDERDLVEAAIAQHHAPSGGFVVHLPERFPPAHHRLVNHLAASVPVVVLSAHSATGDHPVPPMHAVSVTDADEEAREAVRQVLIAAHHGTPFEAMAIVWPIAVPYARIVTEHLTAAGIPWNGRTGIDIVEQLPARLALGWLRLDRRGLRRTDLFDLLSHCPARRRDGRPVPVAAFERICRRAGVHGRGDWADRLQRFAHTQRQRDADSAAAALADDLLAFVGEVVDDLGPAHQARPPSHWAHRVDQIVMRWLHVVPTRPTDLPAGDIAALETLERVTHRLRFLDDALGPMVRSDFADLLEGELQAAPNRVGRLGSGVQVGPLSYALGQPLELLVVLGAAEGLLPTAPALAGLLSDHDRALAGGQLTAVADRTDEQLRQLAAAVAGSARTIMCVPRGDLRATAARPVSRVLTEMRLRTAIDDVVRPSFAHTVSTTDMPATPAELCAQQLLAIRAAGGDITIHPSVTAAGWLGRAITMSAARRSPLFNDFDGYLPDLPLGTRPLSATGLERWARCPWHYFVDEVLGVRELNDPELSDTLSPQDRGILLHASLDDLHQAVLVGSLPQPSHGWLAEHEAVLAAAYARRADELEARGASGRRALWVRERAKRWRELVAWLQIDGQRVAESGATIVASEVRLGSPDPFEVLLPSGRALTLRGTIDRIDRDRHGLVVTDHKTGSMPRVKDDDPTEGGRALQLALYALAAPSLVGDDDDVQVRATYAQVGTTKTAGFTATATVMQLVYGELDRIVAGIDQGVFVADPQLPSAAWGRPPCAACDPDGMGTASAYRRRAAKLADLRVAPYLGIVEAESAADD